MGSEMCIRDRHLPIWHYILTTGSEAEGDQTSALICIRCYTATHESRGRKNNGPRGWIVVPSQNYAGRRFDGNFTVKHFFSCKRRGARRSACVPIGQAVEWTSCSAGICRGVEASFCTLWFAHTRRAEALERSQHCMGERSGYRTLL